jgi:hypothetical protein
MLCRMAGTFIISGLNPAVVAGKLTAQSRGWVRLARIVDDPLTCEHVGYRLPADMRIPASQLKSPCERLALALIHVPGLPRMDPYT